MNIDIMPYFASDEDQSPKKKGRKKGHEDPRSLDHISDEYLAGMSDEERKFYLEQQKRKPGSRGQANKKEKESPDQGKGYGPFKPGSNDPRKPF